MNIGSLLTRHARLRPQHTAVVIENQRLSFADFNRRVNRTANALVGLGIGKGDKVVTILPNSLELLDVYWAAAKIGAVAVPLSPLLRGKALANLIRDSDATTIITHGDFRETLDGIRADLERVVGERCILTQSASARDYCCYESLTADASDAEPPAVEIDDDDPYNLIYSSGTTGEPKGIVLTHKIRALYGLIFASSFRMRPESVVLHAGSIVFNGAFVTLMPAMYLGTTYVLAKQFDPKSMIELIERERVTHMMIVPSQIIAVLHSPHFSSDALSSLEMVCNVGAPLHREHKEELNRRLPGRFYELYGLTEGFVTVLDKNDYSAKPCSVGIPLPFSEMRIINAKGDEAPAGEVGEIVGRGPLIMQGYHKRPELTSEAIVGGLLHTGDLGYVDKDGFLFLVDRKKDMIISGGSNVFPKDIEEVIVQHPEVREAAVFGVPDEKWGETPVAAVILRKGAIVTSEALRDWINEHVDSKVQRVQTVVIMQDFPRTTAGKTLKRALREPYWAGHTSRI
jgi:long-chain acyl-CoA synthetase